MMHLTAPTSGLTLTRPDRPTPLSPAAIAV